MNFFGNIPVVANGNINPSVFVIGDTSRDFAVIQATGTTVIPVGVSQSGTKFPPNLPNQFGGSNNYAAQAGDQLQIFTPGDLCWITVGASSINPWDFLTSDANGKAVTATTGNYYGARALQAAPAGALVQCLVQYGKL